MILIYGDVHGNFRHVAHVVKEHRPDAIIFLGDIEAQRPFEKELEGVMDKTEVWSEPELYLQRLNPSSVRSEHALDVTEAG